MLTKIVVIILVIAGGGWLYVDSRTLTEKDVRGFYAQTNHEIGMRNPDGLCAQLAEHYEGTGVTISRDGRKKMTLDKPEACDNLHEMFHFFEVAGEQLGGIVQLDYRQTIRDIRLAANRRSAEADVDVQMDVAGALMNVRSSSTDKLIKRNWVVLVEASESKTMVRTRF